MQLHDSIFDDDQLTIPKLFQRRLERTPEAIAYKEYVQATRSWQGITWRRLAGRVNALQTAINRVGLSQGDRVGILLPNCTDWVAFDIAVMGCGLIVVPLYLRGSPASIAFVIRDSGARLCVLDNYEQWLELKPHIDSYPDLKTIWIRADDNRINSENSRLKLLSTTIAPSRAAEVIDTGSTKRDDLVTLIYTSGTTGNPKGVMLSHRSILWNANAVASFIRPNRDDVFLSILPLAHAFERTLGYYLPMMAGSTIAFAHSVESLSRDLLTVRPTMLLGVPRLFERIYEAINKDARESVFRRLIVRCTAEIGWRLYQFDHGKGLRPGYLDRLFWSLFGRQVARRVKGEFGGRLRAVVSAGAPLPVEINKFMAAMGIPIVEGYGLTEAAPAVTGVSPDDILPGSVGYPLPGLEIKSGEKDELLVKSPGVMQGYWGNPEATSKVIDKDGWLHTGDIGEIREGRVYIRGRLKDIIVLSTGENVNPSPVEQALLKDPLVVQACALGDQHSWLAAVLVVDEARWRDLAIKANLNPSDPNAPAARKVILSRLEPNMSHLPPFSRVRDLHVELRPWTLDSGMITPTLKVKRAAISSCYEDALTSLYKESAGESHQR